MGRTTELRRELKRVFLPLLEGKGFTVDTTAAPAFTAFRRKAVDSVHVVEIQWDKYGRPRFVINFGKCPLEGLYVRGQLGSPSQVYAGWLEESGRLQPRHGNSSTNWFSQEKHWLRRLLDVERLRQPSEVVEDLLRLFPEVEAYLESCVVGEHIRIFRIQREVPDSGSRRTSA